MITIFIDVWVVHELASLNLLQVRPGLTRRLTPWGCQKHLAICFSSQTKTTSRGTGSGLCSEIPHVVRTLLYMDLMHH